MRRRGAGVAAVKKKKAETEAFSAVGQQLHEEGLVHAQEIISQFRTALQEFATKHRHKINKDPQFRHQFHTLCSNIGVDPLASSKGFWAEILGVGDFYYELGIVIVQVCLQTRPINGGIIGLRELVDRVRSSGVRTRQQVSVDDVRRAIVKLQVLGNGFQLIESGGNTLVASVPIELNTDQQRVIDSAQLTSFVSISTLTASHGWTEERALHVLEPMLEEGMIWVDEQPSGTVYYLPSLWFERQAQIFLNGK